MKDPKQMLREILELISFSGDIDEEILIIWDKIQLESILELLNNLPEEKKIRAQESLKINPNDYSALMLEIDSTYSDEDRDRSLNEVTKRVMQDYILEISAALTDTQKLDLAKYLEAQNR